MKAKIFYRLPNQPESFLEELSEYLLCLHSSAIRGLPVFVLADHDSFYRLKKEP
jgi:hypothetical protein